MLGLLSFHHFGVSALDGHILVQERARLVMAFKEAGYENRGEVGAAPA